METKHTQMTRTEKMIIASAMRWWKFMGYPTPDDQTYDATWWRLRGDVRPLARSCARLAKERAEGKRK